MTRERCAANGEPLDETEWVLRQKRDGWVLRTSPQDAGLWFDSKASALRWAEGMGVIEVKIELRGYSHD